MVLEPARTTQTFLPAEKSDWSYLSAAVGDDSFHIVLEHMVDLHSINNMHEILTFDLR